MSKTIDYYLSVWSPWTYLGGARLAAMAAEAGASVRVSPIRLGEVFQRTGGIPLPKRSPERQAYRLAELKRWRSFLGIPIVLQPQHFPPKDESLATYATITAEVTGGNALGLANAIGKALWEDDRDISERTVVAEAAAAAGLDLAALEADPAFASAADTYAKNTEDAIARGVFAVPTYIYGDELLWGQDRLDFLARALAA